MMHENYLPPIGLDADEAAKYLGLDRATFIKLVDQGELPMSLDIEGCRVYSVKLLKRWFNRIPERDSDARYHAKCLYKENYSVV